MSLGRPIVEIDMKQLAALMRFKPRLEDAAAFFRCSPDTIERRIKEETDLTFAEFREQNMVHTRFALVQKALKKAESGDNVMLIFALKNLCGWSDKQEVKTDITATVEHSGSIELSQRIAQLKEEPKGET